MSKGPGAIVFILCRRPPLVAVLGLTGAYIGSGSAYLSSPMPPYAPASLGLLFAGFTVGNGGNAQSRFDERSCGEGGPRNIGAVALRRGLPNGDRDPSFGVKGEMLREGEELTGVSCSCGKKGRSTEKSAMQTKLCLLPTYSQQKCQP